MRLILLSVSALALAACGSVTSSVASSSGSSSTDYDEPDCTIVASKTGEVEVCN